MKYYEIYEIFLAHVAFSNVINESNLQRLRKYSLYGAAFNYPEQLTLKYAAHQITYLHNYSDVIVVLHYIAFSAIVRITLTGNKQCLMLIVTCIWCLSSVCEKGPLFKQKLF